MDKGATSIDVQSTASALCEIQRTSPSEAAELQRLITWAASTMEAEAVVDRILQLAAMVARSEFGLLYLWEEETDRLVVRAATPSYRDWIGQFSVGFDEGLTGWAAMSRSLGLIRERPHDDPRFLFNRRLRNDRWESHIAVPVLGPGLSLVGVMTLGMEEPNGFSAKQISLLELVAGIAAPVIVRSLSTTTPQNELVEAIVDLGHAVAEGKTISRGLHRLTAYAALATGAECAVLLLSDNSDQLRVEVSTIDTPGRRIDVTSELAEVVRSGAPRVLTGEQCTTIEDALGLASTSRSGLAAPLMAPGRGIGLLICLSATSRSFSTDQLRLVEAAASAAMFVLEDERLRGEATAQDVADDLFATLAVGSELQIEARARDLGCDPARPHVLVVAEVHLDESGYTHDAWGDFRAHMTSYFPGTVIAARDSKARALVQLHSGNGAAISHLRMRLDEIRHAAARKGLAVCCGVSRATSGGGDGWRTALHEAGQALEIGTLLRGHGATIFFDELGSGRHLLRLSHAPIDSTQKLLYDLMRYDEQHHTELFRTLECFLEVNGSRSEAAARLFVHRNTLRQRLRKMEEILGVNVGVNADWFELEFALRIIRLRGLEVHGLDDLAAHLQDNRLDPVST